MIKYWSKLPWEARVHSFGLQVTVNQEILDRSLGPEWKQRLWNVYRRHQFVLSTTTCPAMAPLSGLGLLTSVSPRPVYRSSSSLRALLPVCVQLTSEIAITYLPVSDYCGQTASLTPKFLKIAAFFCFLSFYCSFKYTSTCSYTQTMWLSLLPHKFNG